MTETMTWQSLKPSIAEYIEAAMCCPISMIPTLYGVRLTNHVRLGNPVPIDPMRFATSPTSLLWQKAPVYSTNIRLETSPAVLKLISELYKVCFFRPEENPYPREQCAMKLCTPMTYYYIVHFLINRYTWLQDSTQLLIHPVIPQQLKSAWQTQLDWFDGKEVLQYQLKFSGAKLAINPGLRLLLIPRHEVSTFMSFLSMHMGSERPSQKSLMNGTHYIDNIEFVMNKTSNGNDENFFLSFLLPKNHGFSANDLVYLVEVESSSVISPVGCLGKFSVSIIRNRLPCPIQLRTFASSKTALEISSCSESEDQYELDLTIEDGKLNTDYEILVSAERKIPCESSRQLRLKLENQEPITIHVPWPFVVEGVNSKLNYKKTNKNPNPFKLILKKSLNALWDNDFNSGSKLDIERLKPWSESGREQQNSLALHVNLQFPLEEIQQFNSSPNHLAPTSALNEVRHIIRSIIIQNVQGGATLFAIEDNRLHGSYKPDFYLRAHPPLRISPLGAPILLVSVVDHRLAQKLLDMKSVKLRQTHDDFKRIISNGSATGGFNYVSTYTDEGSALLLYMLRLNSTKMKPSTWQSKNLPRYESWFASFLSPLYMDCIHNFSPMLSKPTTSAATPGGISDLPPKLCGYCKSFKEEMKRCSRCKAVSCCDAKCHKAAWLEHKSSCSSN